MISLDVYSAAGVRQNSGPILSASDVRVGARINEIGTFSFRLPIADARAQAIRRNTRVVLRWSGEPIADGLIELVRYGGSDEPAYEIEGLDLLAELLNRSTLVGTAYSSVPIANVISDALITGAQYGLLHETGWTADVDGTAATIWARFDGDTRWAAIATLAQQQGVIVRRAPLSGNPPGRSLLVRAAGTTSGYRALNVTPPNDPAPGVLIVQTISREEDVAGIVNWLLPVGDGEGTARLTLQRAVGGGTYPIQTMVGPDGRILYYLEDTASIATWGKRESSGPVAFKDIVPVDNTEAAIAAAAQALYDAADVYLGLYAEPIVAYRLSVLAPGGQGPEVGETIDLDYHGPVMEGGAVAVTESVRGTFYVVEREIGFDEGALRLTIGIADRPRRVQDNTDVLVGIVRAAKSFTVKTHVYPSRAQYGVEKPIASAAANGGTAFNAELRVPIDDGWLTVESCRIRLSTTPLYSTTRSVSTAVSTPATSAAAASTPETSSASSAATTGSGGSSIQTSAGGGGGTSDATAPASVTSAASSAATTASGGAVAQTSGSDSAGGVSDFNIFPTTTTGTSSAFTGDSSPYIPSVPATITHNHFITDHLHTLGGHTHSIAHTHGVTIGSHTHGIDHTHTVTAASHAHALPSHTHDVTVPAHDHGMAHTHTVTIGSHTHDVTVPSHNHAITYGVFADSVYPSNVTILVNGVDRTAALGGPWDAGGLGVTDLDLDITPYLYTGFNTASEQLLRQTHVVEFACTGGYGMLAADALLLGSVQQVVRAT